MKKTICVLSICITAAAHGLWAQDFHLGQAHEVNEALQSHPLANALASIQLENAFPRLHFNSPLFLTHAGDGSGRIFVVEKGGTVYVFPNDPQVPGATKFLDISARLSGIGETGLLSLAFHPQFTQNKKFYISYCDRNLVSTVSELLVSNNPDQAELSSERILLRLQQPQRNHNAGHIAFGPDGYLYISFGDGFSESASDGTFHGDPLQNGQNRENWFSSVLRIDVDRQQDSLAYAIPPDNPFVGNGNNWKEEIFAFGFRNPWRFSFDRSTGLLWLADVGDKNVEEIDMITKGNNYGWSVKEGTYCYEEAPCDTSLWPFLTDPIFEYHRTVGESITGGYVYRGETFESLKGLYVYGDYVFRKVWALQYEDSTAQNVLDLTCPQNITSFGEDEAGEIYVVGYQGSIYRLKDNGSTAVKGSTTGAPEAFRLYTAYPNPFNPTCRIAFDVPHTALVKIIVYDMLGHQVAELTNQHYAAGQHTVTWNGRDERGKAMAGGVYVYALEAGTFRETGKMLMLR